MGTLGPVPPVPRSCRRLERSQIPGMPNSGAAGGPFTTLGNFGGFLPTFYFFPFFFFLSFPGWFSGAAPGKTPWNGPGMGVWCCQRCWGGKKSQRKALGEVNFRIICTGVATGTTRIPHGNIPQDEGAIGDSRSSSRWFLGDFGWDFSSESFRMEEKRNWCETCEVVPMFSIVSRGRGSVFLTFFLYLEFGLGRGF